ncbi:MAG TPA: glutamine-hydrolyzing carbamoyl-phosphate synthase small subunit, partial [Cyanophyceae cyanobacterium]
MPTSSATPALLVLADGTSYKGWSFGATGTAIGEVVFNTAMTGYQEVATDPSYRGQIFTFTYPELGNTGVNPDDEESQHPHIRGAIARNIARRPSNWRCTESFPDYLKKHNIPGIYGIDTRALTRKIRSVGAMNGGISTEILDPAELLKEVQAAPSMAGLNLVREVTTKEVYEWSDPTQENWEFRPVMGATDEEPLTVVALDFGIKQNILRRLASYGCRVVVVPADTPVEEITKLNPDGIFLSNGPGDPATVTEGIETTKALLERQQPI